MTILRFNGLPLNWVIDRTSAHVARRPGNSKPERKRIAGSWSARTAGSTDFVVCSSAGPKRREITSPFFIWLTALSLSAVQAYWDRL